LTFTSNASNSSLTVPLSGSATAPGVLSANPTALSFGSVQVGGSKNLSETVTNSGGTAVNINQVTASSGFTISGLTAPLKLSAGQSVTFTLSFHPTTAGAASGSLSLTSDASNPNLSIALSGAGSSPGQLSVNPTSLAFGTVTVGSNKTLTASLSASG